MRIASLTCHCFFLQSLLDDFQGHNIDTAANLVEGAGRYLILLPETTQRMGNMLEVVTAFSCATSIVVSLHDAVWKA